MKQGDKVKFRSKNASYDYRTRSRGQAWRDQNAKILASLLRRDPFRIFTIEDARGGFDLLGNAEYPMVKIHGYWIPSKLFVKLS